MLQLVSPEMAQESNRVQWRDYGEICTEIYHNKYYISWSRLNRGSAHDEWAVLSHTEICPFPLYAPRMGIDDDLWRGIPYPAEVFRKTPEEQNDR